MTDITRFDMPVTMHSDTQESPLSKHESVSDNNQKHRQDFKDDWKAVERVFKGQVQTVLNRIWTVPIWPQQLQYNLCHHHHNHHHQQQQRTFSTSNWFSNSKGPVTPENKIEPQQTSTTIPAPDTISGTSEAPAELTRRQQLQRAVKEYGSTVMVFHITISLMSLGGFYLAVSRYPYLFLLLIVVLLLLLLYFLLASFLSFSYFSFMFTPLNLYVIQSYKFDRLLVHRSAGSTVCTSSPHCIHDTSRLLCSCFNSL